MCVLSCSPGASSPKSQPQESVRPCDAPTTQALYISTLPLFSSSSEKKPKRRRARLFDLHPLLLAPCSLPVAHCSLLIGRPVRRLRPPPSSSIISQPSLSHLPAPPQPPHLRHSSTTPIDFLLFRFVPPNPLLLAPAPAPAPAPTRYGIPPHPGDRKSVALSTQSRKLDPLPAIVECR